MSYILSSPSANTNPVLSLTVSGATTSNDAPLTIPSLQDVTINASTDVYTWTQLDKTAKLQVPTTSTNSISTNIVVDTALFFGDSGAEVGSAANKGLFKLSTEKVLVDFEINIGDRDSAAGGKKITGKGYVTGLSPAVSADQPVWVTPITITVDGEYGVASY